MRPKKLYFIKVFSVTVLVISLMYGTLFLFREYRKSELDKLEYTILYEALEKTEVETFPHLLQDFRGRNILIVQSLDKKEKVAIMLNTKGKVLFKQFPAEVNFEIEEEYINDMRMQKIKRTHSRVIRTHYVYLREND